MGKYLELMIGNDIVYMKDADNLNRSGQKRFLDKIFTPSEQRLISKSDLPDYMIWALWSIKESAYKVLNKFTGVRLYSPLSYEIQLNSVLLKNKLKETSSGMIKCEQISDVEFLESSVSVSEFKLFAKTLITSNFIYSNASSALSLLHRAKWSIEETDETKPEQQSYATRELVKKQIAENKGIELSQITISTEGTKGQMGPPFVYINNKQNNKINLSLTHDGPYLAYSYLLF